MMKKIGLHHDLNEFHWPVNFNKRTSPINRTRYIAESFALMNDLDVGLSNVGVVDQNK